METCLGWIWWWLAIDDIRGVLSCHRAPSRCGFIRNWNKTEVSVDKASGCFLCKGALLEPGSWKHNVATPYNKIFPVAKTHPHPPLLSVVLFCYAVLQCHHKSLPLHNSHAFVSMSLSMCPEQQGHRRWGLDLVPCTGVCGTACLWLPCYLLSGSHDSSSLKWEKLIIKVNWWLISSD